MNTEFYKAREFAFTLRLNLFKEHLGATTQTEEVDLYDIVCPNFWKMINQRALQNTEAYREIFSCYPDDNMTSFVDVDIAQKEYASKEKVEICELYEKYQNQIVGNIVRREYVYIYIYYRYNSH